MRRAMISAAAVTATVAGLLVATAPARADFTPSAYRYGTSDHFGWVHRDRPTQAMYDRAPAGKSLLVGNDVLDVGRAFYSIPLPAVPTGSVVSTAELDLTELSSATCADRPTDVFVVGGFSATTTWAHQPAVGAPVATLTTSKGFSRNCPSGPVGVDVTSAVAAALAAGADHIDFELRADSEQQISAFKKFATSASVIFQYDSPPEVPANLAMDQPAEPCASGSARPVIFTNSGSSVILGADVSDPDDEFTTARFDVYAADRQTLVTSYTTSGTYGGRQDAYISGAALSDGATYAWRVTANDGTYTSAPSQWCEFQVDNSVPDVPTQSTSDFGTDTRTGYIGTPGTITISGGGSKAVRYEWSLFSGFPVDLTCGQTNGTSYGVICTTAGAPVIFSYTPTMLDFTICVRAVAVTGLPSQPNCQAYAVNHQPVPDPVHRWTTDGADTSSTSVVDSGSGTSAPLILNGATWIDDGRDGLDLQPITPSLSVNGSGQSAATNAAVLDASSDFTVSVFVDFHAVDHTQTILHAGALSMSLTDSGLLQACVDSNCVQTPFPPPTEQWEDLEITYAATSGALTFYGFFGSEIGTTTATTPPTGTAPIVIGNGPEGALNAEFADPTIYDKALSADQIQQIAFS